MEIVTSAVVFALFARTFLFQAFVVPSSSMEDTVLVGDHLLVNKFAYAPHAPLLSRVLPYREVRRGDVVVFKFPGNPAIDFVKRVVALPGDRVEIRGDSVFVNGLPAGRESGRKVSSSASGIVEPARAALLRVSPGEYFAIGDNRRESYDSRFWGAVPAENLKGRALLVYWSYDRANRTAVGLLREALDRIRRTRWSRTFQLVR